MLINTVWLLYVAEIYYTADTDKCLVEDDVFRPLVEAYAANKTLFFADYAEVSMGDVQAYNKCDMK